jgi:hypothetical protein
MARIISDFESQLCSAFQTVGGATGTGHSLQSWIARCMFLDDSLAWIPQGSWSVEYVKPGEEGADITIEEL